MRFHRHLALLLLGIAPFACAAQESDQDGCETGDSCSDDFDCGSGTRCNTDVCTRLRCLPDGSACETNDLCKSGACGFGPQGSACASGPRPIGWVCTSQDACQAGLVCVDAICTGTPIPEGELCNADGQCASGLFCQRPNCGIPQTGICRRPGAADASCCDSTQCAASYACKNVSCTGSLSKRCGMPSGVGQSCCDASDCQSGLSCNTSGFSPSCQGTPTGNTGVMRAMPESVTLSQVQGDPAPLPFTITVTNTGTGSFEFAAISDVPWLVPEPAFGTAIAGQDTVVTVTVGDAGFMPDTLMARISLTGNATNAPVFIPVTFTISPR